jgi:hypothetical protein
MNTRNIDHEAMENGKVHGFREPEGKTVRDYAFFLTEIYQK